MNNQIDIISNTISSLMDKLSIIQTDIAHIKVKNETIECDIKEIKDDTREARDKSREALDKYKSLSKNWWIIFPSLIALVGYVICSYVDIVRMDENLKSTIENNATMYKALKDDLIAHKQYVSNKCGF